MAAVLGNSGSSAYDKFQTDMCKVGFHGHLEPNAAVHLAASPDRDFAPPNRNGDPSATGACFDGGDSSGAENPDKEFPDEELVRFREVGSGYVLAKTKKRNKGTTQLVDKHGSWDPRVFNNSIQCFSAVLPNSVTLDAELTIETHNVTDILTKTKDDCNAKVRHIQQQVIFQNEMVAEFHSLDTKLKHKAKTAHAHKVKVEAGSEQWNSQHCVVDQLIQDVTALQTTFNERSKVLLAELDALNDESLSRLLQIVTGDVQADSAFISWVDEQSQSLQDARKQMQTHEAKSLHLGTELDLQKKALAESEAELSKLEAELQESQARQAAVNTQANTALKQMLQDIDAKRRELERAHGDAQPAVLDLELQMEGEADVAFLRVAKDLHHNTEANQTNHFIILCHSSISATDYALLVSEGVRHLGDRRKCVQQVGYNADVVTVIKIHPRGSRTVCSRKPWEDIPDIMLERAAEDNSSAQEPVFEGALRHVQDAIRLHQSHQQSSHSTHLVCLFDRVSHEDDCMESMVGLARDIRKYAVATIGGECCKSQAVTILTGGDHRVQQHYQNFASALCGSTSSASSLLIMPRDPSLCLGLFNQVADQMVETSSMKWRDLSILCEKVNSLRKCRTQYLDQAKAQKREAMLKQLDNLAEQGFKAKQVITDVKDSLIRYFDTEVKDLKTSIAQRRQDVEQATQKCNAAQIEKEAVDAEMSNAKVKVDGFAESATSEKLILNLKEAREKLVSDLAGFDVGSVQRLGQESKQVWSDVKTALHWQHDALRIYLRDVLDHLVNINSITSDTDARVATTQILQEYFDVKIIPNMQRSDLQKNWRKIVEHHCEDADVEQVKKFAKVLKISNFIKPPSEEDDSGAFGRKVILPDEDELIKVLKKELLKDADFTDPYEELLRLRDELEVGGLDETKTKELQIKIRSCDRKLDREIHQKYSETFEMLGEVREGLSNTYDGVRLQSGAKSSVDKFEGLCSMITDNMGRVLNKMTATNAAAKQIQILDEF